VYLGLVEVRYNYQLSYLDEWANAWRKKSSKIETFNIVRESEARSLASKAKDLDFIVVLHSVTADSNVWLSRLANIDLSSRAPMILFVGNEFSSPFLSTETRLHLISQIAPEFIASQLRTDTAKWLYEKINSHVISAPPGLPELKSKIYRMRRPIDLGFRGYKYPWYLLDQDRNETVESVAEFFLEYNKNINISNTHRFNGSGWFEFLQNSHFTVSSEAGSAYVFRDDEVWRPIQEYFKINHKFAAISNDALGMKSLRKLPSPIKKLVKLVTSKLGVTQASLYNPDSREKEELMQLINPRNFEFRNGKAISSRHFDAIACGTWQILKPGAYNGILEGEEHYSSWNSGNREGIIELMENPNLLQIKAQEAFESLKKNHTYDSRVEAIIREVG
jgi:hypothetical protein